MAIIYLIECVRDYDTVYKIGYTGTSPNKRLDQLKTGNDGEMKVVNQFNTQFSQTVERTLHRIYNHKNINKEWFKLDLKDVQNFIPTCEKIENNLIILKNLQKNF